MPPLTDARPTRDPAVAAVGSPPPDGAEPALQRLRLARADLLAGRVGSASRQLVELVNDTDEVVVRAEALSALVECRLAQGDLDSATVLVARLASSRRVTPLHHPDHRRAHGLAEYAAGALVAARGDAAGAAIHLLRAGELLGDHDDPATLPWRIDAALALTATGRREQAAGLIETHRWRAQRAGSAYGVAQALRGSAVTDLGVHRERLLREARAALAGVTALRLGAQIDTDLAGLLLLTEGAPGGPRRTEALGLLVEAERYAVSEELWPLRSRVGRLFEHAGVGPSGLAWERFDQLSAAERRVVGLAVGGLTNREIAGRLDVTVKAVEWHLSRVYRKLGIRSRRALATTLGVPIRTP